MIEVFSVQINHRYHKGQDQALKIVPLSFLKKYEKNNRVFFKYNNCDITIYLEDDKSLLQELNELEFWVLCNDESFYKYTELPNNNNGNKQLFFWDNSLSDSLKTSVKAINLIAKEVPFNAVGKISIATDKLSENKVYEIVFQPKKVFWQYEITGDTVLNNWQYELVDEEKSFLFSKVQLESKIIFRSKQTICYVKQAKDRLKLIWYKENNIGQLSEFEVFMPFPNYNNYHFEDKEIISTVYMSI